MNARNPHSRLAARLPLIGRGCMRITTRALASTSLRIATQNSRPSRPPLQSASRICRRVPPSFGQKIKTQRGTRRGARLAYAPWACAGAQHSQASHRQPSRICGGAPVQPQRSEKIVGKHGLYRWGLCKGPAGRPRRGHLVAAENWPGRTACMRRSGRGALAAASRRQRNRRAWKRRRSCRSRSSAST